MVHKLRQAEVSFHLLATWLVDCLPHYLQYIVCLGLPRRGCRLLLCLLFRLHGIRLLWALWLGTTLDHIRQDRLPFHLLPIHRLTSCDLLDKALAAPLFLKLCLW